MSADVAPDLILASDLPPRTWNAWWLAWPKWLRIGCWGLLGLMGLHVALAIRMAIGLIEADEIAELRKYDSQIRYVWDKQGQRTYGEAPYTLYLLLNAGFRGCSCAHVEEILLFDRAGLDQPIATDRTLEHIANHFPNVKSLHVENADIRADGLAKLRACRHLEQLSLAFTDVDDNAVEQLVNFPRLTELSLAVTRVTNVVIPILQRMKALKSVDLGSTDVTLAAIKDWKAFAGTAAPVIYTDHRQELTELLSISVRWSNGIVDDNFATPDRHPNNCLLRLDGPLDEGLTKSHDRVMGFRSLSQMSISSWDLTSEFTDGNYRLTLSLVGCASEPLEVDIRRDSTKTQHLQFVMAVTKEQALEKWRLERTSVEVEDVPENVLFMDR